MPNYVKNIVIPRNSASFARAVSTDTQPFSFEKIEPMPVSLKIKSPSVYLTSRGLSDEPNKLLAYQNVVVDNILSYEYRSDVSADSFVANAKKLIAELKLKKHICKMYNINDTPRVRLDDIDKSDYENLLYAYFNTRRYGVADWYHWRLYNWGSKWDTSMCSLKDNVYEFGTAWSAPVPIYTKLGRHHDFVVLYADEDYGSNCGALVYKNGSLAISRSFSGRFLGLPFAHTVWGNYRTDEEADKYYEQNTDDGIIIPDPDAVDDAVGLFGQFYEYWNNN